MSWKSGALLGQNEHFLLQVPDSLISTSEGRGILVPLINWKFFSLIFFFLSMLGSKYFTDYKNDNYIVRIEFIDSNAINKFKTSGLDSIFQSIMEYNSKIKKK